MEMDRASNTMARDDVFLNVVRDTLLPLGLAALLVTVLTDQIVNHVDPRELRLNTLLMGTRPFRVQTDAEAFLTAIGSSALLLVTSVGFAALVGVPAGLLYGSSRVRALRGVLWAVATIASALPAFFWAVAAELVVLYVASRSGIVILPQAGFGIDQHLLLPTFALAARPAAFIFRLTAGAIDEIRSREYVRTADAKGLSTKDVLLRHIVPNAAPTIVAAIVFGARYALSSLPVVEFVYVWGGAGLTFLQAIGARQSALAAGLALSFAVASVALQLVSVVALRGFRTAVS